MTELNSPTAVEKLKLFSSSPLRYTYVEITSAVEYVLELYSSSTFSDPTLIIEPIFRISITTMVGAMPGRVTCRICRNFPAPTMRAAS